MHVRARTHTHTQRSSNSYSAGLPTCAKTTDGKEVGGAGSNRKWVGQVAAGQCIQLTISERCGALSLTSSTIFDCTRSGAKAKAY